MSGRGFVGPVGSDVALPGFMHKVGAPLLVYRVLLKRFGVEVVEALGAALACGKRCPPYAMNVRCVQRAARRPTCSGIAKALWARRFAADRCDFISCCGMCRAAWLGWCCCVNRAIC